MPKESIHERLAWGVKKSEMENQKKEKWRDKIIENTCMMKRTD